MATFFYYTARAPPSKIFDSPNPIKNFGGNTMYYKNNDYTARTETHGESTKYFIRFHGVVDSPEVEVDLEMFTLYVTEFKWPLERERDEKRRHIADCDDIEAFATPGFEAESLAWLEIEAALKTCTQTQHRRFRLHLEEYSYAQIARLEGCTERAVRKSVEAVRAKVNSFLAA